MLYEDVKKVVEQSKSKYYVVTYVTGNKEKIRLFSGTNGIGYLPKGRRRYGYTINPEYWMHIFAIKSSNVSPEDKWIKTWTKVKKMLEKSGLWNDVLERVKTGLELGHEKIKLANTIYWSNSTDDVKILSVEKISPKLIKETNDNRRIIDTDIVWSMNYPAKIKKMYFGKNRTFVLDRITGAMKKKIKISENWEAGYDVSFEYNPKQNKAWYSEEYRNCGNGHYYLALSDTHALFYEDD